MNHCARCYSAFPEHWCEACRAAYEERAAIVEFDGGLSRPAAEAEAMAAHRGRMG